MTLARQQWLFLGTALALLFVLAAMLVDNQRRVAQALDHLSQGQSIVRTILMMRIVAGEMAIDRTDRHEIQWRAGMRDLVHVIDSVRRESALENTLLQRMKQNTNDADELFHRFLENANSQIGGGADDRQTRINNDRINDALQLTLGNVNLTALRLSELEAAQVRAARQKVLLTSTFLFVAMLMILVAYVVVFRKSVLAPINRLQVAADRVASGDLEHRVGLTAGTEIGELGRRFDHMADEVQASRTRMVAANRELEAFAYSVSHDLRAPLRGMDGFSRILLEQHTPHMDEDALHCLKMIRDNAQQMGHLIDDLLAFSRLSQQPLRKERVDQEALVRAVLEVLLRDQDRSRIAVTVGTLPTAEADPGLLKQVWVNLIANALKFTRGREKALIDIGCEMHGSVPVYFVKDNGIGFDMRYAHKLFEVFQRLNRAEHYEGTGVGLAIVRRVVTRHGGRIWAKAVKDHGATFYFTLQEVADNGPECD